MIVRFVEGVALFIFFASIVFLDSQLILNHGSISIVACFLAILPAYFLADLFSGLVHWVCDSFGSSTTPLWGPMLIKPFRDHHNDPGKITRISLIENLGASAIAGVVVFWIANRYFLKLNENDFLHVFNAWLLSWFLVFSILSNLFHRWAHIPKAKKPAWMRYMQNQNLILNSDVHLNHHKKPYRINYCILCGWANAVTNRTPWSRIEKIISMVGIKTNFE